MIGQRVEVEEVTDVNVALTEWILNIIAVAVGRSVDLRITNKDIRLHRHQTLVAWHRGRMSVFGR